jgi:hypothetical protein
MSKRTWWETTKVQGGELVDKVRQLVREGNVRRIVIKQGDRGIAEFPLTAGVVGVVFAPVLAAVGAIAALVTDCSIAVQREEWVPEEGKEPEPEPATGSGESAEIESEVEV